MKTPCTTRAHLCSPGSSAAPADKPHRRLSRRRAGPDRPPQQSRAGSRADSGACTDGAGCAVVARRRGEVRSKPIGGPPARWREHARRVHSPPPAQRDAREHGKAAAAGWRACPARRAAWGCMQGGGGRAFSCGVGERGWVGDQREGTKSVRACVRGHAGARVRAFGAPLRGSLYIVRSGSSRAVKAWPLRQHLRSSCGGDSGPTRERLASDRPTERSRRPPNE